VRVLTAALSEKHIFLQHAYLVTPPLLSRCKRPGGALARNTPGQTRARRKNKGLYQSPAARSFQSDQHPVDAINHYLQFIHREAEARGYNFDRSKIDWLCKKPKLKVTKGQIDFELKHLAKKLRERDKLKLKEISALPVHAPHPMFSIVEGGIESWEIV
jgi:hypothetical protein